jgi:CheY-like chemotaxis protein
MESQPGVGSRFFFSLTFARSGVADEGALGRGPAEPIARLDDGLLSGARVLIAEDDPVNRLVARDLLQGWGAAVTEADNGRDTVALAAEGGLDIILMDIQMPEMDGYEACRAIRALPGGKALPIIALTAHALTDERRQCEAAGMNDYVTKPVEPDLLYAALCRSLGLRAERGPEPAIADELDERPLPGFDADKVRRWRRSNPAVYQQMLQTWMTEYGGAIAAIETALDADEVDEVVTALHRLRGAAGVLGASELELAARGLEEALRRDGRADTMLRRQFVAAGERVITSLAGLDMSGEGGDSRQDGPSEDDGEEIGQRLAALEELLVTGNTRALDYLPWLKRCIGSELPGDYRVLVRQMEELDFEAALRSLRGLKG